MDVYVIIMAGGVGSRFWPYSRNKRPKQFLDILGTGRSLLQMTYQRFLPIVPSENILVVTNSAYHDLVKEQLPLLSDSQILLEPYKRNTAPCIAYASYKIWRKNAEASVVVAPADHVIFNENLFQETIQTALQATGHGDKLITIGICPNRPHTGYGYIQYIKDTSNSLKKVKQFTEKPSLTLAEEFIKSDHFVWNSGIFVWRLASIKKAFEAYQPDLAKLFEEAQLSFYTDQEEAAVKKAYEYCPNLSIDYGVMEKADNVYVVLGDFGWSDLGSWKTLYEIKEKDHNQNVIEANALAYNCTQCFIKAPENKLIVVQDLKNYLVTVDEDVVLICKKDQEKDFRKFVEDVKNEKGEEFV